MQLLSKDKSANNFFKKVTFTPSCWFWMGSKTPKGYGGVHYDRKRRMAHRVVWEIIHGERPKENIFVCHKCDFTSCVNPDHLFLGTNSDNIKDSYAKGRSSNRGEKNPRAKLTWDDVREIRRIGNSVSTKELAKRYKMTTTSIWQIKSGENWRIQ